MDNISTPLDSLSSIVGHLPPLFDRYFTHPLALSIHRSRRLLSAFCSYSARLIFLAHRPPFVFWKNGDAPLCRYIDCWTCANVDPLKERLHRTACWGLQRLLQSDSCIIKRKLISHTIIYESSSRRYLSMGVGRHRSLNFRWVNENRW
jgi:hypothetical protein